MFDELLASLSPGDRDDLLASMRPRQLRRGDVLFHEGDRGDAAFVIDGGHLIVERTTEMGDIVAVAIVGAGDLIGEQALLSDEPRFATARAVNAVDLRVIARSAFDDLRRDHRGLDRLLIRLLDERMRHLSDLLLAARHRPADDRIRGTIRQLHDHFGTEIPLSQEVVASLAGTTRPTANGIVRALQDDGIVELSRGRLRLIAPERL